MIHRPKSFHSAIWQVVAIGVCLVAAVYVAHAIIELTADTSPAGNLKLK
ncbi:hypothetical protein [Mesorhizobium sp. Cs1299R1N3]